MGYKISSIKSLPLVPGIDLYIFILGKNIWSGGWRQKLEKNFNKLAREIGPTAAIISGHDGVDLVMELVKTSRENCDLATAIKLEGMKNTSILILGAHPSEFTNEDLALIINETKMEEMYGSMEPFLDELTDFAQNRNENFLNRFENKGKVAIEMLEIIELKPNIFGFGININSAISKILNWKKNRPNK